MYFEEYLQTTASIVTLEINGIWRITIFFLTQPKYNSMQIQ